MTDKPRIPPSTYSTSHTQLQKEIFVKEARVMGFSRSPDKPILETTSPEVRPQYQSALGQSMYTSQEIPSLSKSRMNPRNHNNSIQSNYTGQSSGEKLNTSSKSLENIYKARIGAAIRYKDQYDFNNRSPITWLGKKDSVTDSNYYQSSKSSTDDALKLSTMLNSKRILKGMGYMRTNIFNN